MNTDNNTVNMNPGYGQGSDANQPVGSSPNAGYGQGNQQYVGGGYAQAGPEQYNQWAQQYQQGNVDQVPHDQVHQAWGQFTQQASPQQVQQAATQGFQQIPQQQHSGIASSLLNMFQHHGLDPQAAGVQTTNPQQMTPEDMGRMTQYASQQKPDALKQMFQPGGALSNPLIGVAVAGALAYGVSQFGKK